MVGNYLMLSGDRSVVLVFVNYLLLFITYFRLNKGKVYYKLVDKPRYATHIQIYISYIFLSINYFQWF